MTLIILLVEDSPIIRENLISTLKELVRADVVGWVEGEAEALEWLEANKHWTMAIVDLFLKQGSGLGVLQALKQRDSSQRVVVLSNYATPEMRSQCARLGADKVFDKSTELDQFLEYCAS